MIARAFLLLSLTSVLCGAQQISPSVHDSVTSVILSREPGSQIRVSYPARPEIMRLTYLGDLFRFGQEGRCSLDPGRPAVRFPRWPTGSRRAREQYSV